MPTYLPPDKVLSCLCKSRREQNTCTYGHPDECHYSLSCTQAACGHLDSQGYTHDEISSVTEISGRLIESLSSADCPRCSGRGLLEQKLWHELFSYKVLIYYAQVCRCVIANNTAVRSRRRSVNVKQVEQARQSKRSSSFKGELDLHGLRVEDALTAVDRFLRSAWDNNHGTVVIIHGKGRRILRDAVRDHLGLHPSVVEFSSDSEDAVLHVTLRKR